MATNDEGARSGPFIVQAAGRHWPGFTPPQRPGIGPPFTILAERFPDEVLPAFARRTSRLEQIVHHLGLALGGRPGADPAQRLMLPVSRDTLLRVIRRRATARSDPLGVIGIDDFASCNS